MRGNVVFKTSVATNRYANILELEINDIFIKILDFVPRVRRFRFLV